MKNFPLILFCALAFSLPVSAQTDQTAKCPTLDVSSGGAVAAGQPQTFTAKIENYDASKLSFNWTISSGEILEGQGTPSIMVLKTDDKQNITVTVEIDGVEGCPGLSGSETEPLICNLSSSPVLVDEFSISTAQIDKAKLDDLIGRLQTEPNSQGYMIEYFRRGTPRKVIDRKLRQITDYLSNEKKFEKERITIQTGFDDTRNLTEFWIVPPGASNPEVR